MAVWYQMGVHMCVLVCMCAVSWGRCKIRQKVLPRMFTSLESDPEIMEF